jgi:hypothetical protein
MMSKIASDLLSTKPWYTKPRCSGIFLRLIKKWRSMSYKTNRQSKINLRLPSHSSVFNIQDQPSSFFAIEQFGLLCQHPILRSISMAAGAIGKKMKFY